MNEGVLFLIAGAVIFVISGFIRRVAKRAKTMSSIPRYSDTVDMAPISADIYTEHGMVYDGCSVRPRTKRSASYYETLFLGCWL